MTASKLESAKKEKYIQLRQIYEKNPKTIQIYVTKWLEEVEKYHCNNSKSTDTVLTCTLSFSFLCSNLKATE